MSRLRDTAVTVGGVVSISIAVLAILLVVASFILPESITQLNLGFLGVRAYVSETTGSVVERVRLNPALDIALLIGSYVFISTIGYFQDQLSTRFRERRHFE